MQFYILYFVYGLRCNRFDEFTGVPRSFLFIQFVPGIYARFFLIWKFLFVVIITELLSPDFSIHVIPIRFLPLSASISLFSFFSMEFSSTLPKFELRIKEFFFFKELFSVFNILLLLAFVLLRNCLLFPYNIMYIYSFPSAPSLYFLKTIHFSFFSSIFCFFVLLCILFILPFCFRLSFQ